MDKFFVEIKFDHPYWSEFKADRTIADFDRDDPNPEEYLRRYHDDAQLMANLSRCLAAVVCPGKPEKVVSASGKAASSSVSDPVAEIQLFKELLDQGILTEEEFAAKKRQLLGL